MLLQFLKGLVAALHRLDVEENLGQLRAQIPSRVQPKARSVKSKLQPWNLLECIMIVTVTFVSNINGSRYAYLPINPQSLYELSFLIDFSFSLNPQP